MVISVYPLVLAVLGVLVFALSNNAKLAEIGKWVFVVAVFWLVYSMSGKTFKL